MLKWESSHQNYREIRRRSIVGAVRSDLRRLLDVLEDKRRISLARSALSETDRLLRRHTVIEDLPVVERRRSFAARKPERVHLQTRLRIAGCAKIIVEVLRASDRAAGRRTNLGV